MDMEPYASAFAVVLHVVYSLHHRKCGVRGFIHELFVSKTRTSEVRVSEGFLTQTTSE